MYLHSRTIRESWQQSKAITTFVRLKKHNLDARIKLSPLHPRSTPVFLLKFRTFMRMLLTLLTLSTIGGCLAVDRRISDLKEFAADDQIYLSKKSRFIKFDSKDNEIEIELGVSIPVVKIPLAPELGRGESGITVSGPGLVVAGILMIASFVMIPLLFSPKIYKDFRSDMSEDIWKTLSRVQKDAYEFINSSSCLENIICHTAKISKIGRKGSVGKWLDKFFRNEWVERLIARSFLEKAVLAGRSGSECSTFHCAFVK